jgi:hypothetical protein
MGLKHYLRSLELHLSKSHVYGVIIWVLHICQLTLFFMLEQSLLRLTFTLFVNELQTNSWTLGSFQLKISLQMASQRLFM